MYGGTLLAHSGPDELPPPLTPELALTTWVLEPLPVLAAALAAGLYLYGARRLAARGAGWVSHSGAGLPGPVAGFTERIVK